MEITAILLVTCLLGAIFAVYRIKRKLKMVSRLVFGTDSFLSGLKKQEVLYAETPKSVSSMTKMLLPVIERDFPEFHWPQWKQLCENRLKDYLETVEQHSIIHLQNCSPALNEELSYLIEDHKQRGIQERFDNIKIHQTEIYDYKKAPGMCKIKIQSSVEYLHSLEGGAVTICNKKEQHRYNSELFYIQDISKIDKHENAIQLNCPNCGAPITDLGSKQCHYCGCGIIPISIRTWSLNKIEKKD